MSTYLEFEDFIRQLLGYSAFERGPFGNPVSYDLELDENGFYDVVSLNSNELKAFRFEVPEVRGMRIRRGIREICAQQFYGFNGIKELILEDGGVQRIGKHAFRDCRNLKKVTLSATLQKIEDCAFAGCTSLEEIVIPDSVRSIGDWAFWQCSALKRIVLPSKLLTLSRGVLCECSSLEEVELPPGLKRIAPSAFQECRALKQIRIPETVTEIADDAFSSCSSLREIRIPAGTELSPSAFRFCYQLERIEIDPSHPKLRSDHGLVRTKDGSIVLYAPDGITGVCEIPDGVQKVMPGAMHGCVSLQEVRIPESVKMVGASCFEDCHSLKRIVFPTDLTKIPDGCCKGCVQLQEAVLPDKLEIIGERAFQDTELEEVVLPAGIRVLGKNCFRDALIRRLVVQNDHLGFLNFRETGLVMEGLAMRADNIPFDQLTESQRKMVVRDFAQRKEQKEPVPEAVEKACMAYVRSHCVSLFKTPLYRNLILENAILTAREFPKALEQAEKEENSELTARLLQYQHVHGLEEELNRRQEARMLRELNQLGRETPTAGELRKIWKTMQWDEKRQYLTGYRGSEENVVIPAVIGRSQIAGVRAGCFSAMPFFGSEPAAVFAGREKIRTIVVSEGIRELGDRALAGCKNLREVKLPESLRIIGDVAFQATAIEEIEIPEQVLWIGEGAFGDTPLRKLIIRGKRTDLYKIGAKWHISKNVMIYAPEGSRAQYWAKENKLSFTPLDAKSGEAIGTP